MPDFTFRIHAWEQRWTATAVPIDLRMDGETREEAGERLQFALQRLIDLPGWRQAWSDERLPLPPRANEVPVPAPAPIPQSENVIEVTYEDETVWVRGQEFTLRFTQYPDGNWGAVTHDLQGAECDTSGHTRQEAIDLMVGLLNDRMQRDVTYRQILLELGYNARGAFKAWEGEPFGETRVLDLDQQVDPRYAVREFTQEAFSAWSRLLRRTRPGPQADPPRITAWARLMED